MRRSTPAGLAALLRLALAAAACVLAAPPQPARAELPTQEDPRLQPAFSANHVWNAVATTTDGRVFVGYPGADGRSVEVEELRRGLSVPYPDLAWNSWVPGTSPEQAFVRINSLRIGPDGALWLVDAGAPGIGKPAVPGAARAIRIDLASNTVSRIYILGGVTRPDSYVDDIRFHGGTAYLTDAGHPGLIVLDLATGAARRVLDGDPSTTDTRPMYADETLLRDAQGRELRVHADQLEVSPDGQWLYYQPASGPLSRIATAALDDPALPPAELARQVQPWVDTPTTGGTAIDAQGNIYLSDTRERRILKITPDRQVSVLIADPRLIWSDAMWIDDAGMLWIPATQQNLTPGFADGRMSVRYPVWIYRMPIGVGPPAIDHP